MEKDTRLIFIEAIKPFVTSECHSRIAANIDIIEQRLAANGYMGHLIQKLQKTLELACNDAADGCCPYDSTDGYQSAECRNCPNLQGNREDSGLDASCWEKYYLTKADEALDKGWTEKDDQELKDQHECGHDRDCIECKDFLACNYGK